MARPLRIEYPGAWYHVLNRGRRREKVFFDARDYRQFLGLLAECTQRFSLEVHAYSLMPNHYHLLLRTPKGNLSRIIRHLDGVYTQRINRRYGYEGSLFKGRFKSILVEEESYLIKLVQYIHRNPLKAKLEKQLGRHPWTSHRAYMNKKFCPEWLFMGAVLSRFGEYEKEALRKLDAFVKEVPEKEFEKRLDGVNWPAILGGDTFKGKVKEMVLGKKVYREEVPQYRESLNVQEDIQKGLDVILTNRRIEKKELFKKRSKEFINLRRAFIYLCVEYSQATAKEIAELTDGISIASVRKQYQRATRECSQKIGCWEEVKTLKSHFQT